MAQLVLEEEELHEHITGDFEDVDLSDPAVEVALVEEKPHAAAPVADEESVAGEELWGGRCHRTDLDCRSSFPIRSRQQVE